MAVITSLTVANFRNLTAITIACSPYFNIFSGDNGAGKTSLLEAIYYIGLGKSFRSSASHKIIQHNSDSFTAVAKINSNEHQYIAGISYHHNGLRQIKLNSEEQQSIAAITKLVPMQFMSPMSYRFFHDGPKTRRQYLDWALFHVEQCFLTTWRTFQRILKQRNSALKQQQSTIIWNAEFIETSEKIDQLRQQIVEALTPLCLQQLAHLLPTHVFQVRYQRGWPKDQAFSTVLSENEHRDQQLGYTYYGPQRADFQLLLENKPIQDVLSQGQQKLAAYALHLSLGSLLQQQCNTQPIYLIDDLPSELDSNSREKILASLHALKAQTFITGIAASDLASAQEKKETAMFHVEHGSVAA